MSPNQHFCLDYSRRAMEEERGKKILLPSEGKAVLIHMHCLVNFAGGVDSW